MSTYSGDFKEMREKAKEAIDAVEELVNETDGYRALEESVIEEMNEAHPGFDKPERDDDEFWDDGRFRQEHDKWERSEPKKPERKDFDDEDEFDDALGDWKEEHYEWKENEPQESDDEYFLEDDFLKVLHEWEDVESSRGQFKDWARETGKYGEEVYRIVRDLARAIWELHGRVSSQPPDLAKAKQAWSRAEEARRALEQAREGLRKSGPYGDGAADDLDDPMDTIEDALGELGDILEDIMDDSKFYLHAADLQNMHRAYHPVREIMKEYSRARSQAGKGRYPLGWGVVVGSDIPEAKANQIWGELADVYDELLLGFPRFPVTTREFSRVKDKIEVLHDAVEGLWDKFFKRADDIDPDEVDPALIRKIVDILTSDRKTVVEKFLREMKRVMNTKSFK